jgi:RHS repeat-associated protein
LASGHWGVLRPLDTTAPTTPTALTGTPVTSGRIDLSWTASTDTVGVAGYNLYRDAVKVNTVPIGSTSYSDTNLVAGASHTYTVRAVDASANESTASTSWSGAAGSGAVTTTYTYDTENRLTQLASGSNTIGSYAYDGAGNRIGKTAGGVTTVYTLDLASSLPQVLAETAGSAVTSYAYAGAPLELDQSGTTYWYLSDTLGSVRLVTDSVGASPATYAYSAFGSTRTSSGTLANEVRFSGERTDTESGLEFLRARTYDPSVGTFLQRDTWGITATNSQSIDAYAYTENDPTDRVDPSGHSARVYDEGPVHHGLLQASTAYAVPIKAQSAAQRGDVLSGASDTSAQRQLQRTLAKKAASTPKADSGCGFDPTCYIDRGWQATGGAGVNWVADHPQQVLATVALASALIGCALISAGMCLAAAGVVNRPGFDGGSASWRKMESCQRTQPATTARIAIQLN